MQRLLILLAMLLLAMPAFAQRDSNAEVVTATATDGLTLVGEFYAAGDIAPTVLLLHMLNSSLSAWEPLLPTLTDDGYNVLAVDMRGHGSTGGARDWTLAERDVTTWLDWLSDQPSVQPDRIAIVGASIGANLALIGCAFDERCVTAIALSPGLDYSGVVLGDEVTEALAERSALLVSALGDVYSADSVRALLAVASGDLGAQFYVGRRHGTELLRAENAPAIDLIQYWLREHLADQAGA
ncbi:MAG: alpha/beta fold hydrolase [Chloroflexota bacterium]|nr:alpha/beta fold hydrolase [Chloroflexota bacterium]